MTISIQDVYSGKRSSAFSFYGTSPESPDGTRIAYVVYSEPSAADWNDRVPGELWVCESDLNEHRKCADVTLHNHNGACAVWVDNNRLLYNSGDRDIYVIDVNTCAVLHGPIKNLSETHSCVNHAFAYVSPDDLLCLFNCDTGESTIITSLEEVNKQACALGREASKELTHLHMTADGKLVAFRHNTEAEKKISVVEVASGKLLETFPGMKPMHFSWYDNESLMGSNWDMDPKDHRAESLEEFTEAAENHYFQRFHMGGGVIETLGGTMTHGSASADREWYAGEAVNYGTVPMPLNLYKKGLTQPVATLMEHSFGEITWTRKAHVNPSFSRDGKRVYFTQAVSDEKFVGSFVDISEFIN